MNKPLDSLLEYVETLQEFDEKVLSTNFIKEKVEKRKSRIFQEYKQNIQSLINFSLFDFEDLFFDFDPIYSDPRKPGPKKIGKIQI